MLLTLLTFLILGGLGFPIPEEFPLLLGGIGISKDPSCLPLVYLVCYAGVMFGDHVLFFVGHFFGHHLVSAGERSDFLPFITQDRVSRVREGIRRNRILFLLLARHVLFLRPATLVVAGSLRLSYLEFLVADLIAASVSVSIFITLGYLIGEALSPGTLTYIIHRANLYLLSALILGVLVYTLTFVYRRSRLTQISGSREPQL